MPLSAGSRLGPFEILAPLGEGGMGEVYRASDTRLNRAVALKVLPDAFALDRDRLARFDREAQVVAALNHPNIATLYGVEDIGGRKALVLELVEGPTLAERMAEGPIPQEEAIAIAKQIADALEAAHEQGIVHRDLKPANIKLRPDGTVKVLDFGLAKLTEGPAKAGHYEANPTLSPTLTSPAVTGIGVILGTAAYMAPEQAAGKLADKRADIWSFGVVLWEMRTGERLFAGESTSYVLADVLRSPINFERIPAGPLRELLQRCLDRDVKTRLRDIGEARVTLNRPLTPAVTSASRVPIRRVHMTWAAAVVLLAIVAGVALWALRGRPESSRTLMRFEYELGADVRLLGDLIAGLEQLSPDGTRLAYAATVGDTRRLYIRRLDSLDNGTLELRGTDGAGGGFFSPDGRSLAFTTSGKLHTVSVDGGAPLLLAEGLGAAMAWVDEASLVVEDALGLKRIFVDGGKPVRLTELAPGEVRHVQPHVPPGAQHVVFVAVFTGADGTVSQRIEAVPIGGGPRTILVANGGAPHVLDTGHLLYLRDGTLFAIRVDPDSLKTDGDAVPMVTGVNTFRRGPIVAGTFSIGGNGTLVYRAGTGSTTTDTVISSVGRLFTAQPSNVELIDAAGKRSPLISTSGTYRDLRFSPDGTQLALSVLGARGPEVSVYDPRRDTAPRKVSFDGIGMNPVWVFDGRYIVFGDDGLMRWTRVSGGQPQRLLAGFMVNSTGSFSITTKRLAFDGAFVGAEGARRTGRGSRPQTKIYTVALNEEAGELKADMPQPFTTLTDVDELEPQFSPDSCWIAFVSDRSKRDEVWVRSAPSAPGCTRSGPPFEVQVSDSGGDNPRWARTRNELLYRAGDRVMSVSYETASGAFIVRSKPQVKIEKLGGPEFDLAPDGRIVVPTLLDTAKTAPPADHTVVFIQNFADEVRRRVK